MCVTSEIGAADKVNTILDAVPPKTELQAFIRLVNYYEHFGPN